MEPVEPLGDALRASGTVLGWGRSLPCSYIVSSPEPGHLIAEHVEMGMMQDLAALSCFPWRRLRLRLSKEPKSIRSLTCLTFHRISIKKKNYNTKNPSLPQTLCQAEGCYLWGNIDVTTKTPQEKTSCCCLILQDHLSLYKRNSNAANWRCFWERQRIWLCDRHASTSCRAALRTRCHALWGHSPCCCRCRIVPHRVTGLGITSSPVLIQPDIELYWELL